MKSEPRNSDEPAKAASVESQTHQKLPKFAQSADSHVADKVATSHEEKTTTLTPEELKAVVDIAVETKL